MSVQLILYPQTFDGETNVVSSDPNESVTNGVNFNGLNLTNTHLETWQGNGTFTYRAALVNAPPAVPNTWYRFKSSSGVAVPSYPANIGGKVALNSTSTLDISGIYQKLTNLTTNTWYKIRVTIETGGVGVLTAGIQRTNPNHYVASTVSSPASGSTFIVPFNSYSTAINPGMADNFFLTLTSSTAETIIISNISILPLTQTPSGAINILGDGQVICDLYEEEDIPLTLSIDEFKNAAEQVKSYSKAFMLPGTKRNNQIFQNLFEVTRSQQGVSSGLTFNPYAKTQSILKQDGFVLFEGYLRVIDIQEKKGEISYNVNLYSEVIALADSLKDKPFSDLNFYELFHDYDKDSIEDSWDDSTGLPLNNSLSVNSFAYDAALGVNNTNVLKYPFVDWNHQLLIANGSTGTTATAGMPELTSLEQVFRPFIQIKYLIDKIFEPTPFSYTSSFFNTADFKKLFMDFNWGGSDVTAGAVGVTIISYYYGDSGATPPTNNHYATTAYTVLYIDTNIPLLGNDTPANYDDSTHILTSTQDNEAYTIDYAYYLENTSGSSHTIECQWLYNNTPIDYSGVVTIAAGGTYTYTGNFAVLMLSTGDTLKAVFKADAGSVIRQVEGTGSGFNIVFGGMVSWTEGMSSLFNFAYLQNLRGELKQWEFLKGLFTMFNLISMPDESNPTNILIEPYADIFINNTKSGSMSDLSLASRSIQHDWTEKIDVSEMKLVPLTDLKKKVIFKFVEDEDDWAFMNYKKSVQGHLYGSKLYDATLTTGNLQSVLEGEEEIIAEPFAATIPKPYDLTFSDLIVPTIYSYNTDDNTTEAFDNSPRIMYNDGKVTMAKDTYYIPDQNGVTGGNTNEYLLFSHLTEIPTNKNSRDFHFGQCQLMPGVGAGTVNNLFNIYWQPYFDELYNPDTRTMTIKVNLSPSDINTFNFHDTIFIKNRQFRVNKIDYKPTDLSTVEFILIP